MRDLMGLTKINFNSCLHSPMRSAKSCWQAPQIGEPRLPFKFYI